MNRNIGTGSFLILIGIIFLFQSLGFIEGNIWSTIWPVFVLVPALGFHYLYFSGNTRNPGVLVPGGILLILSGLFFYHTITGWETSQYTWPFYLFAVAFGLFELYIFGEKENGLLVPIIILTGIGVIFSIENVMNFSVFKLWPVLLILIGISILTKRR